MTRQEFKKWQEITKSSHDHWIEDEIYRLNGRGVMYYRGGEDGIYIKIEQNGKLEIGDYTEAFPHIGEACYKPVFCQQYDNFNAAYKEAMEIGGVQFLKELLSRPDVTVSTDGTNNSHTLSLLSDIAGTEETSEASQQNM